MNNNLFSSRTKTLPDMENMDGIKSFLSVPRDICITSHRNPDGDAIGSSLGLALFLTKQGHTVKVTMPSEYPVFFSWMPQIDSIIIYDTDVEYSKKALEDADLIFALDYNSLDRIDKMGEYIHGLNKKIALIDHHLLPDIDAEFALSDTTASSTSELIYLFISYLGGEDLIDKDIAECLYTGIVTDTGSFKYSTSARVFRIVGNLLDKGVDDYTLQNLIYNSLPEKNLRLLGHCLINRMEIFPEYRAGIIWLTKEDYETFDIRRGDTEGIVNYLLMIGNVVFATFITEQPNIVKLSFRSKGDFSVQEVARRHFKGGGHKNASGGSSFKGLNATLYKLKSLLPQYKEALNN